MLGKTEIAKLSQDLGLAINSNILNKLLFVFMVDKNNKVICLVYDITKKEQQS